jgi:ribosomal protein S18 acetylase RimI-like enzyme
MPDAFEPVRLTQAQREHAIAVMGRAFVNDPFLRYLAPDDMRRARLTPQFVAIVVTYCLLYGEVWTSPSLDGVACWLEPGKTSPTFGRIFRTGMLMMPLKFGWAGFQRFNDVINYAETLHKKYAAAPHWYLWGLGVDPAKQGRGVGGALLRPVLERADRAGQICYLETQNEVNLHFYRKYGFEVAGGGVVPRGNLQVWAMVRQPKAA